MVHIQVTPTIRTTLEHQDTTTEQVMEFTELGILSTIPTNIRIVTDFLILTPVVLMTIGTDVRATETGLKTSMKTGTTETGMI